MDISGPYALSTDFASEQAFRFQLLSNVKRLRLVHAIYSCESSTTAQYASDVGVSENDATYLLKSLVKGGFVERTQIGRSAHFRLVDERMRALVEQMDLLDNGSEKTPYPAG